jgi:glycosyltransferase involved in cell wall biosynthesis
MANRLSVSIIVTSYNHERFVASAIQSALNQDYPVTEVIVVDDGSSDNSSDIIAAFGSSVKMLLQTNQGQVAACTNGFSRSQHDIVIFLDSDDVLAPDAASKIVRHWTPKTAKIQFCLGSIDHEGRSLNNTFPKYSDGLTPARVKAELLRCGTYPATPTSGNAFARGFLQHVLPLAAGRPDIDDALSCTAPLYGEVVTLAKVLGSYRIHSANTSAQNELSARRFKHYIEKAEQKALLLRHHCQKLGIDIDDDLLDKDLYTLEYSLASAKLDPELGTLPCYRSSLRVAVASIAAVRGSIFAARERLLRVMWVWLVAVAPRRLAVRLIAERFLVSQRRPFTEAILGLILRVGSWRSLAKRPGHGAAR